jgi:S-DNA-T family DNA segregation ATPase FtsK/SpoIIIE
MPKLVPSRSEPPRPYPSPLSEWQPPSIDLLSEPSYHFGREQEKAVREKATVLEQTLSEYRIEANVVEIDPGPAITLYEVQLAPGVKVSQIHALSNDISRALKAPMIRVISPIPGKNTIGIEVPNADREIVRLRELIAAAGSHTQQMTLPLYLGKDSSGNPLVSDLARMPHMLVAGTTGSGKSICLNTIILSLLMTQRPDVVKLILVDPKMVELSVFRSIPHLMCPIVTEVKRAAAILDWAVTTMEERYEILAEGGVRNIAAYNRLGAAEIYRRFNPDTDDEKARIPLHLPHIIIVIDELADMMMTCGKEVELYLARLAQKSRAVGIHIIVATQRPEAKIVTGLIKSNLPCRIAFRVASRLDSRIVLDQNGAELLLGQGDMLFLPPGSSRLIRSQGTYVDDVELKRVLDDLAARSKPEFHPDLVKMPGEGDGDSGERDELFDAAVRVVLDSGRGSVSLLQRKLTIGYSRASRLVEQMAAVGVVGDYKGSQAREVLMSLEDWEAMCGGGVAMGSAVIDAEEPLNADRPVAPSDEEFPSVSSAKNDDDDEKDDDEAADDDEEEDDDWDDEFDDDVDVDEEEEEEEEDEEEMSVRQPPAGEPFGAAGKID